jgi:hypothetical protein
MKHTIPPATLAPIVRAIESRRGVTLAPKDSR